MALAQHQPAQQNLKRPNGRATHTLRPIQLTFDGLARVDGSARFSFGAEGPCALASLSGPIEVRLAAELPAQATFEVLLRPLAGVPTTEAKALAAVVRGALAPGLLLTRNPRTLVQLVVQVLVPAAGPGLGHGQGQGRKQGQGQGDGVLAAAINAGTLALLNAGSVPMKGVVCAVAVGRRKVDGAVVVDPEEDEELSAVGCFAYLIGCGEQRIVWTRWGTVIGGGVDEEGLSRAEVFAKAAAAEVYETMKEGVERMGRTVVPFMAGGKEKEKVTGARESIEDADEDDGKMEI